MASPPPPQMVLGPYYFGVVVNVFLYGILVVQAVIYYQGYKRDQPWLRLFVFYLFFVETVNTGMCVAMIYEPLIAQFGTDSPMLLFPTLLAGQPFMEIAISTPVQFFYAWRISVILQSYIASILICLASVGAIVGAFWSGINLHHAHTYLNKDIINHPALIWSICAASADLMITVSLITSLSRRKTGIKSTDDAVNRIVRNTLQTGAITGAFAVLDIVLFLALPNSTLSFVFDFGLPKLYSNAVISTLNSRRGSGGQAHGTTMGDQSQRNVLFTESTTGQGSNSTAVVFNKPYARTEFIEMNSDMLDMPYNEPK